APRAEVVDQPEDVDRLDVRGVVLERLARLGLGLLELKTTEVVLGQLDPGGAALGVRGAAARTPSKRQSGQRRKDSQARPERQGSTSVTPHSVTPRYRSATRPVNVECASRYDSCTRRCRSPRGPGRVPPWSPARRLRPARPAPSSRARASLSPRATAPSFTPSCTRRRRRAAPPLCSTATPSTAAATARSPTCCARRACPPSPSTCAATAAPPDRAATPSASRTSSAT